MSALATGKRHVVLGTGFARSSVHPGSASRLWGRPLRNEPQQNGFAGGAATYVACRDGEPEVFQRMRQRIADWPTPRRLVDLVALVILWGAGIVLWLVLLRDVWAPLDAISPLTGHALAAGAVAIAALVARRHGAALLVVGGIATGILQAAPVLPMLAGLANENATLKLASSAPRTNNDLRIVQINTWHGNRDTDSLVRYLEASDADIAVLSEFGPSKRELVERLARSYPFVVGCPEYWSCSQLLLSRRPFVASGAQRPDGRRPPIVWARLKGDGVASPDVTVVGTHIYRPSLSYSLHRTQLDGLIRFLGRIKGELIVAGDFNITTWSQSYEAFLVKTRLTAARGRLPTWPAWPMTLPQFQIDHLFVSSGLAIHGQRAGAYVGSDHLPLHTVVRVPSRHPVLARHGDTGRSP